MSREGGQAPRMKSGEFTAEINGLRLWHKVEGRGPRA